MRVFEITPLMHEIAELIESGVVSDELQAKVDLLVQDGPKAIDDWVYAIREVEAQVEALSERIRQLQERKKARQNTIERMRELLQTTVAAAFSGKVKTAEFTVSIRKGTDYSFRLKEGKSFNDLPTTFYKTEYSLNTKVLKDMAKDGIIPEAIEIEETTTESLTIRG